MKRTLVLLLSILTFTLHAQDFETAKIKQLKRSLPNQKGIQKIDGMISICMEYYQVGFFDGTGTREDSISKFVSIAKTESEKIRYKKGISHAMVFEGFVRSLKNDYSGCEKDLKNAIQQEEISEQILGYAYCFLGALYRDHYNTPAKAVEFLKPGIYHFRNAGDIKMATLATTWLAMSYQGKNDLINALDYYDKAINETRNLIGYSKNDGWVNYIYLMSVRNIIELYKLGGDYSTAKEYLYEYVEYVITINKKVSTNDFNYQWADIYRQEGKYDSALYFLKKEENKNPEYVPVRIALGETYLESNQYSLALQYLKPLTTLFQSRIGKPQFPRPVLNFLEMSLAQAEAYYEMEQYDEANKLSVEALQLLRQNKNRYSQSPIQLNKLFADGYKFTGQYDSAFFYYTKYNQLKDSIISKQLLFKLYNIKKAAEDEQKITQMKLLQQDNKLKEEQIIQEQLLKQQKENALSLLDKENKLTSQQLLQESFLRKQKEVDIAMLGKDNKLKQQQLRQESFTRNVIAGGFLALLAISAIVIRTISLKRKNEKLRREKAENDLKLQHLENEKKHAELQQQAAELEMQALKAQMNPHFIFNCLSSINWLILEKNSDAASDYLNRFSKLIRMVLTNSEKTLISLDEELKMLQLYLDMEQLRFENSFEYKIDVAEKVLTSSIQIPPLLIQPFCENAIWHGLLHKDDKGKLNIKIDEEHNTLYCTITDNGVGRQKASELDGRSARQYKSMGLKITSERLALFNSGNGGQSFFEIEDLINKEGEAAGTRVMLKIKNYQVADELVS